MKRILYGSLFIAVIAAIGIFLVNPPATTDRAASTTLAITFRFPEGYEFTEGAPFILTWRSESPEKTLSVPAVDKNFNPLVSPYKLSLAPAPGSRAVILNARLYYCDKTTRMCFQDDFRTRVPLEPGILPKTRFPKREPGFLSPVIPWVWEIAPKETRSGFISPHNLNSDGSLRV